MVPPWVLAPVTEADVGMQHEAQDHLSEALCQRGAELLEKMPLGSRDLVPPPQVPEAPLPPPHGEAGKGGLSLRTCLWVSLCF